MREVQTSSDQPTSSPFVVRVVPQTIPAINQSAPPFLFPSNGTLAVQIGCQPSNLPMSFQPVANNQSTNMYATLLQTPDGHLIFQPISQQAPPINLPISCFANPSVDNPASSLPDNISNNILHYSVNGQSSLPTTSGTQAAESNNTTSTGGVTKGRPRKRPVDSRSAPTSTSLNHRLDIPNPVPTASLPSVASPSVPSTASTPAAVSRAGSMTNSTASLEDGSLRDSSSTTSRAARSTARTSIKSSTPRSRPKTSPQPPPKLPVQQDWLARKLESLSESSRQAITIIDDEVSRLKSNRALDSRQAELYKQLNEARSKILQGQEVVVNQLPNGAITISARQAAANTASSSSSQSTSTLTTLSSAPILQPPATSQAGLSTASVPARATAAKFPARPRARAKPAQRPSASVHSAPAPVDAAVLPAPLPCSLETFAAPLPVAPAIAPAPFHQSFVQALLDPSDTALEDPALPLSTAQLETVATRVGSPGTRLKIVSDELEHMYVSLLRASAERRPFESVEDAFQQLLPYALYADPADTADSPGALETPVSTTDSSSSSCRLSPPTDPVFSSTFLRTRDAEIAKVFDHLTIRSYKISKEFDRIRMRDFSDYTIENDANAVLLEQLRLESAREAFEHEMQEPSAFLASESLTVPRTLPNAADSQSYIGNNLEAAPISTTARISGARSQTTLSDVGEQENERLLTEAARISDLGADLSSAYPETDLQSQSFDLMAQLDEQSDASVIPPAGANSAASTVAAASDTLPENASHQTPSSGFESTACATPARATDAPCPQVLSTPLYDSVTRDNGKKLKLVLRKRPSSSFNSLGGTSRSGGRNAVCESGSSNFSLVSNGVGVPRSSTRIRIKCNAQKGAVDDSHADSFGKLARMAAGTNGFAALSRSRLERLAAPSNSHHYRDRSVVIRSLPMARKNNGVERPANAGGSTSETLSNGHTVVTNQLEAAVSSILADTESNASADPFAIRSQFDASDIDLLI